MKRFQSFGATTKEETLREINHRALAKKVAEEGIVLLKNDGILPLKTRKISLFGAGARMTVKGGSGSGEVHERYSVTVEQGLKNAGFEVVNPLWIERFNAKYLNDKKVWRQSVEDKIKGYGPIRTMKMFDIIHMHSFPYPSAKEILADELSDETDTAIYVLSRQAGENHDRKAEKGDYYLSDTEENSLRLLSEHYKNVILIINCGCVMDLSILDEVNIGAVLFIAQAGLEGGNALADIIAGKVNPSGKLTDTWAYSYHDYPSADTYGSVNGELEYENYYEGIYIGYKYFNAANKQPRFPFGFGLSYTDFEMTADKVTINKTEVSIEVTVKNTGNYSGKEVVQVYLSKPCGRLDHEPKALVAFCKTKLLAPMEEQTLMLSFDMLEQTSFDEEQAVFILEKGEYGLILSNSSAKEDAFAVLLARQEFTAEKVQHICSANLDFKDFTSSRELELDDSLPRYDLHFDELDTVTHIYDNPVYQPENTKKGKLLASLNDKELISLCVGGGYPMRAYNNVQGAAGFTSTQLLHKGIPNIVMSDGPAGLNVLNAITVLKNGTQRYPEGLPEDWTWGYLKHLAPLVKTKRSQGTTYYRYMTAFPSAILRAQTFNLPLMEEVGKAIGVEMLEIGLTVWEAPGMNLHRNPLCGRNFEYYSEDVLLSGLCAAAETKGLQSNRGVSACLKHFCCNNQEDNRDRVTSNVSERALREVYLHNFKIAVINSQPQTIMSSYNRVNGIYSPNSYDLITKVLRNEWHFDGVVMSDWNATDKCSHPQAILAGNDLIMPGNKNVKKALVTALKSGEIKKADLMLCASRILKMIMNAATAAEYSGGNI